VLPRASGSGGQEHTVDIRRARSIIASILMAAAALAVSAATVLAEGGPGPLPK